MNKIQIPFSAAVDFMRGCSACQIALEDESVLCGPPVLIFPTDEHDSSDKVTSVIFSWFSADGELELEFSVKHNPTVELDMEFSSMTLIDADSGEDETRITILKPWL